MPAKTVVLINLAEMAVLGPVINLIPTLGEELGWRGYLLPKLRTLMPDRAALILTGVIWGVWHLPVIVLGHNYGTAYWGYPWLGILAMIVFCVSLGILEGSVSVKVGSAVPAAMIHSAVNAGAGLPLYLIKGAYNPVLGPALTGFIGGLPMLGVAAVLLVRSGGRTPLKAAPEQT
jgi:membrane protease YdiL (CAAX protease family)